MRSLSIGIAALALIALAPGLCEAKRIVIRENTNNKNIVVSRGDILQIVLAGNPTTGYSWQVGQLDPRIFKLLREPEYRQTQQAIGGGGFYSFELAGMAPGAAAVTLVYLRPWEKKKPPAKTFRINVMVK